MFRDDNLNFKIDICIITLKAQALQMMQAAVLQQQRIQQMRQEAEGSQVSATAQMRVVEGQAGAQAQWVNSTNLIKSTVLIVLILP